MDHKKIDDNQHTLDDFLGESTTIKEEKKKVEEVSNKQEEAKIISNDEVISENISEEKAEEIQEEEKLIPEDSKRKARVGIVVEEEMEIRNVFLLDVEYDGPLRKAVCKFYDPVTHDLYLWYDNTNHLPYLLTTLTEEEVRNIPQVVGSEEYVSLEKEKRRDLMRDQEIDVVKVVTTNPLAIGGRNDSFREIIYPSFESNIRYHYNYIFDNELVPGGLYSIINGKLIKEGTEIPVIAKESLEKAFEGASNEELEMLERYFPQFLSPIPDILRCAFDIEVYSPDSRLPAPQLAQQEIISIVVHDSLGEKTAYLLKRGEKEPEIDLEALEITEEQLKIYEDEAELLKDFFEEIKTYPIILSFNGDNFDLPYLLKRAENLGIKESCPIKKSGQRDMAFSNGSIHIDLHRFYRQAAIRVYAFSGAYETVALNDLGEALLNEGKVVLDESISDLSAQKLLKYNLKDTEITLKLTTFANNVAFNLILILMRITKMPMFDFTRTTVSTWIENWFRYEHRIRKYLIPNKEAILEEKGQISTMAKNEGAKFQGAIVIDPVPGVHWNVFAMDFASLYPSIIKTRNLSYETLRCPHEECKVNKIPETDHWVCGKVQGISALLLGFVRDIRVNWFKPGAKDESLTDLERNANDVIQASLKVLINAGYGVFGAEIFGFYCPPVAESTTALAREAITKTKKYSEVDLGVPVLYGDTDSLFLKAPTQEQIEDIQQWSIDNLKIDLGIDYIFRFVALSSRKKNYFGITTKSRPIVKGMLGKKRNTPTLIKTEFSKMINLFLEVSNMQEFEHAKDQSMTIVRELLSCISDKNFTLEDIAVTTIISQRTNKYKSWVQPLQAIMQLEIDDRYDVPEIGAAVTYVKTHPFEISIPNKAKLHPSIMEPIKKCTVKPIEFTTIKDVDIKKLKALTESTFSQVMESIGIEWFRIEGFTSIEDFF